MILLKESKFVMDNSCDGGGNCGAPGLHAQRKAPTDFNNPPLLNDQEFAEAWAHVVAFKETDVN